MKKKKGKDGKALLLSKYLLDCQAYDNAVRSYDNWSQNWEECTLRAYLNDDFYTIAFNEKERDAVIFTEVDNGPDQGYSGWRLEDNWWKQNGCNNTFDRIFLLSCNEVEKYIGSNKDVLRGVMTDYLVSRGPNRQRINGKWTGIWWLRSPGHNASNAACITYKGFIGDQNAIFSWGYCIRPSLWVDLRKMPAP